MLDNLLGPSRVQHDGLTWAEGDAQLATMVATVITSNTALAAMPGNVFVPAAVSSLPRDSVVNVTAIVTLDKSDIDEEIGQLPASLMDDIDRGLRRVFGL